MGEALLGHPRACHILSVERKNKHPRCLSKGGVLPCLLMVSSRNTVDAMDEPCVPVRVRVWGLHPTSRRVVRCRPPRVRVRSPCDPLRCFDARPSASLLCVRVCGCAGWNNHHKPQTRTRFLPLCALYALGLAPGASLFTDLSVAGLPAELKHITQRRKRKQP